MRLAHLSDLHLLHASKRSRSLAAQFVSLGRPLDVAGRRDKAARALRTAHARGADHLILSGDLTEVGGPAEFEALAEVLVESSFRPEQVTLVPGNHDAYTGRDGWSTALAGPLRAYRSTSSSSPKEVTPVDLGAVVLLPVDTTRYQSVASSCGVFTSETARALAAHLPTAESAAPRVIIQHHPPFPRKSAAWQYIDGLQGWPHLYDLLVQHPRTALLHGHMHSIMTRSIGEGSPARVFGASATVDDRDEPRLRIYAVHDGMLRSVGARDHAG